MNLLVRIGAGMFFVLMAAAVAAPWIAPENPFRLDQIDLNQAGRPPVWSGADGQLLGTDAQGRDLLSLILYGLRLSFAAAGLAVLVTLLAGVPAGLLAGYAGGLFDSAMMRLADAQMSFPLILIAIAFSGMAAARLGLEGREAWMLPIVSVSIGLSQWAVMARAVRAVTAGERGKSYVEAAQVYGAGHGAILLRHILPNTLGPVTVLAAMQVSSAVLAESTLSFLGAGLPISTPSLGTLVRTGNEQLLAGNWWLPVFPGLALLLVGVSASLAGEWVRQRLDPKAGMR